MNRQVQLDGWGLDRLALICYDVSRQRNHSVSRSVNLGALLGSGERMRGAGSEGSRGRNGTLGENGLYRDLYDECLTSRFCSG